MIENACVAKRFVVKSLGKLGPGDGGNRPGVWQELAIGVPA